jgi:hypothetical protein
VPYLLRPAPIRRALAPPRRAVRFSFLISNLHSDFRLCLQLFLVALKLTRSAG